MEDQETIEIVVDLSVHDLPPFMQLIEAAIEVVRCAKILGFIEGSSPDIDELHKALIMLSPKFNVDEFGPNSS